MQYSLVPITAGRWRKLACQWVSKLQHHFTVGPLCQRQKKYDKIPYVQFFIVFYQNRGLQEGYEVIPVLDPTFPQDLLDLLPQPPSLLLLLPPTPFLHNVPIWATGPKDSLHISPLLQNPVQQQHKAGLIISQEPATCQEKCHLWGRSPMEKDGHPVTHTIDHF